MLLGHSWGLLGAIGGTPGVLLGTLWHSLGLFGLFLGPFCALLWHLWACLLGVPFGVLWGAFGVILDTFGRLCGHFWRDAAKLRKHLDFLGFPQLKDTRGLQK